MTAESILHRGKVGMQCDERGLMMLCMRLNASCVLFTSTMESRGV
jgi:hypothetical protein